MPKAYKSVAKRLEFLEEEVVLQRALRWTVPPEPIFPRYARESVFCRYDVGWAINVTTFEIFRAWSSNVKHGRGEEPQNYRGLKGPIRLFKTRLDAALALRHAYERVSAAQLMKLDARIETEREEA